jgi:hypothetical protein
MDIISDGRKWKQQRILSIFLVKELYYWTWRKHRNRRSFANMCMDVFKNSSSDSCYHTFYNIVVNYHVGVLSMSSDIDGPV